MIRSTAETIEERLVRITVGPPALIRYNNLRAVTVTRESMVPIELL